MQLRDRYEEFRSKGAEVVAIGMGFPAMAADFREQFQIPFRVLIDSKKQTYRALELRRGGFIKLFFVKNGGLARLLRLNKLLGGGTPKKGQDVAQLGGSLVVGKGGSLRKVHQDRDAGDALPVDELLAALP